MAVVRRGRAIRRGGNEKRARLAGSVRSLASVAGENLCVTALGSRVGHIAAVLADCWSLFLYQRRVRAGIIPSRRGDRERRTVACAAATMTRAVDYATFRRRRRRIEDAY